MLFSTKIYWLRWNVPTACFRNLPQRVLTELEINKEPLHDSDNSQRLHSW